MKYLKFIGVAIFFVNTIQIVSAQTIRPYANLAVSRDFSQKQLDHFHTRALKLSRSANSYTYMELRAYISANNMLVKKSGSERVINFQKKIITNLMSTAQVSSKIKGNKYKYKDHYEGWIVKHASAGNKSTIDKEVPLFESYTFSYVAQFLYILKDIGWVDKTKENKQWWEYVLHFVEENIWKKWESRSAKIYNKEYYLFLRNRTHMGSHWAELAMYLKRITNDKAIKSQCVEVQAQYDLLLQINLKPNPQHPTAYIWNATYDNVKGTDALAAPTNIVQDVSHGNQVVSYIVDTYELGNKNWTLDDLHKLCNTFKLVMYDNNTKTVSDRVNGKSMDKRSGWGNFVADGWVKLSKYDRKVARYFRKIGNKNEILNKYNQSFQFRANYRRYDNPSRK